MFVSSTSKLIPCVTFTRVSGIMFHVYSETDKKFVEYIGDKISKNSNASLVALGGNYGGCKRYKKGECYEGNDAPTETPIFLTDDDAVRQAAKELLKSRPEPFGDEVASVMLRDQDTTYIHWYRVTNKGMLKLFSNADPIDITNMEDGDVYNKGKTEIFFSPISAINTVKNYLENVCNDIIAEAIEREAKEASEILNAKSFIEKINKAQEI